jgi:hypothetical protein
VIEEVEVVDSGEGKLMDGEETVDGDEKVTD